MAPRFDFPVSPEWQDHMDEQHYGNFGLPCDRCREELIAVAPLYPIADLLRPRRTDRFKFDP